MNLRIAYERSVNVLASSLAMAAQRLPFLKNLTPIFGGTGTVNFTAPLTVTFVGTHSLSGQSITIVPVNGATNPAPGEVGEQFVWAFKASEHSLRSAKVEMDGVEAFPPGLTLSGPQSGIFFLAGIPTEGGNFTVKITGYRNPNFGGNATVPYVLSLDIEGEGSGGAFDNFVATFWSGDDLSDPLLVGPRADPDSDGIENVMEFVLDLDPTKPEAMPGTMGVDPSDSTMLRYEIPLNSLAGAFEVGFEQSSNLDGDWKDVPASNVTRIEDKVVLSAPLGDRKYYRFKVSLR